MPQDFGLEQHHSSDCCPICRSKSPTHVCLHRCTPRQGRKIGVSRHWPMAARARSSQSLSTMRLLQASAGRHKADLRRSSEFPLPPTMASEALAESWATESLLTGCTGAKSNHLSQLSREGEQGAGIWVSGREHGGKPACGGEGR